MFSTDKPISKIEDDMLNRASFSKELAKAILSYTNSDNFAISLCGEWGCGKTSILNMVVQEINECSKDLGEDEKPVIINFNPWNYSDKNQLISQFFKEIVNTISTRKNSKSLAKAGDALQKYSSIIDYTKYIPVAGKYIALLKPLFKNIGKKFSEMAKEADSIENQKRVVINALKELKQKIIVIIDDIDRLNNDQIRLIFQLVNSVAGFPNMIYLLSFDRTVVTRALSQEQNCNGEEYLEKIIQVPFDVPVAKKELVNKVLFRELDKIISNVHVDMFDKEHWDHVFEYCISEFIHSIRDVNRLINSYKLKYALMKDETNWVDLLCITTLQICAPEIYKWIKDNIDTLTGTFFPATTGEEQQKAKDSYLNEFKKIYNINPALMLKVLQELFPRFSWKTGQYGYAKKTEHELRYLQRISSPEYSSLYFHLSLEDVKVTRKSVINTIQHYQTNELRTYLQKLKSENLLASYFKELNCCIELISKNRLEIFFTELINIQADSTLEQKKGIFEPSANYLCKQCACAILKAMPIECRQTLFEKSISNSSEKVFCVLLEYILNIEQSYGRIGTDIDSTNQILPEESLMIIERECEEKLELFSQDDILLDNDSFYVVSTMWKYLNEEKYDKYLSYLLKDEKNVPKFLLFNSGIWHGNNDRGWTFSETTLQKYMSIEEMYKKIQSLKGTEVFHNLTEDQKQIAIAYSLWYEETDKTNYYHISLKRVLNILPGWEIF